MKVTLKTFKIVEEDKEIEISDDFKTENPAYMKKRVEEGVSSLEDFYLSLTKFENAILAKIDNKTEFLGDEADIENGHNFITDIEDKKGNTLWEY